MWCPTCHAPCERACTSVRVPSLPSRIARRMSCRGRGRRAHETHGQLFLRDIQADVKSTAEEWPVWDSESHPCDPPGSGKFPFDYAKQVYGLCMTVCMHSVRRVLSCIDCRKCLLQEERVLIICGKATLTPDDGSAAVTISAGDFVRFHRGSRPYECTCPPWWMENTSA